MHFPLVSAIVPGHNASSSLAACLASLRTQDWPRDKLEIIYIDDASTDDSSAIARQWADQVVRLEGSPRGPAAARNAGAGQSSGEILVFLDSDVVAPEQTVSRLAQSLMEDASLDAVFGSYDCAPPARGAISQYRNLLHHYVHQTSREEASTFWAGCGAIRKRSFEQAGGFDAGRYRRPMIEDIELGHRMKALGMRMQLLRAVQVKHLKRWTFPHVWYTDVFARGIPWMRLLLMEGKGSREIGDLNLKLSGVLSVLFVWLGVVLALLSLFTPLLLVPGLGSFAAAIIANLRVYRFFCSLRGPLFVLKVLIPHLTFHFFNGFAVIGGLFCWALIDRPLPGLRWIRNFIGMGRNRLLRRCLAAPPSISRAAITDVRTVPVTVGNGSGTGFRQNAGVRVAWQVLFLLIAWIFVIGLHWKNDGLWMQGDAPRHAANGIFWKDYLLSGALHPETYAFSYYARYPVIAPTAYPPVFYVLEGALFGLFRPSPHLAKMLVLVFALMSALYLMVWLRRWVAPETGWAAALLLLQPGFVIWSHAVMLNVPATAMSIAALFHARRWLEEPDETAAQRQLLLAAALAALASLTYFQSSMVILVVVVWLLALRKWKLLLRGRAVRAGLVCLLILLPWLYVAFKWAPVYVSYVTGALARVGHAAAWGFYARELGGLVEPHLLILGTVGVALGLAGKRRRRESWLLLLFAGTIYTVLSLLIAQERRYALLLCVPAVCFIAIALHAAGELFARFLGRGPAAARPWTPVLAVVLSGLQAWGAADIPVPAVNGFREAVRFVEQIAPAEPVFYDGYFSGIFTFYIQAGDPEFQRQVVLGSKLLYTSAMNPLWRYREFVSSTDDIVEALRSRGGCRWIVVERSQSSESIPAARLLRAAVAGPQFELVRSFPISGLGLQSVEVYRFKPEVEPVQEWDIPFQILGEGTRFRIRPIKR